MCEQGQSTLNMRNMKYTEYMKYLPTWCNKDNYIVKWMNIFLSKNLSEDFTTSFKS